MCLVASMAMRANTKHGNGTQNAGERPMMLLIDSTGLHCSTTEAGWSHVPHKPVMETVVLESIAVHISASVVTHANEFTH